MTQAAGTLFIDRTPSPAQDDAAGYEADFYTWTVTQGRLLREGRLAEADLPNIIEEIESLGRSEYASFERSLARVIQHLLKWDYQPERRTRSWRTSINVHRAHAKRSLKQNPGFKGKLDGTLLDAYELAVAYAVDETSLEREAFPRTCPYDFETVMTRDMIE